MYKLGAFAAAALLLMASCVNSGDGSKNTMSEPSIGPIEEQGSESILDESSEGAQTLSSSPFGEVTDVLAAPPPKVWRCCYYEKDCPGGAGQCRTKDWCASDKNKSVARGRAEDRCQSRVDSNDKGCWYRQCKHEFFFQ
jgi:hypothetical protein